MSQRASDKRQRLQLHLGCAAPKAGELQVWLFPAQVTICLVQAANRPAQIAEDFPEADSPRIGRGAAGRCIGLEESCRLAEAPKAQLIDAKPPVAQERPGQIF